MQIVGVTVRHGDIPCLNLNLLMSSLVVFLLNLFFFCSSLISQHVFIITLNHIILFVFVIACSAK